MVQAGPVKRLRRWYEHGSGRIAFAFVLALWRSSQFSGRFDYPSRKHESDA